VRQQKRMALEDAGFRIGDAEDFLGLSEEECSIVELRVAVSRAIRQLRGKKRLSQQQLATKLGSSQSRVAKIEAAGQNVSLDLLFRGLFALGGKLSDLGASIDVATRHRREKNGTPAKAKATRRKRTGATTL
jgi:predicted XRE-type DNA-binding protein